MLYSLGSRSAERAFVLVFANDFCLHGGFFLQLLLLFVPGRKGFVVLFCYAGKKEKHSYAGKSEGLFETIMLARGGG